jgi:hypothetical protein
MQTTMTRISAGAALAVIPILCVLTESQRSSAAAGSGDAAGEGMAAI